MAYCTQSDVETAAGGAERLVQLADWDGDGIADAVRITSLIARVESWMNSYIVKKRAPLQDPVLEVVKWTCAEEVAYRLKRDRGMVTPDDHDAHVERVTWLDGVAAGRISLGADPAPAASSNHKPESTERTDVGDHDSKDALGGFW